MLRSEFNPAATQKLKNWLIQKTKSWSFTAEQPSYNDLIQYLEDGADPNIKPDRSYYDARTYAFFDIENSDEPFGALQAFKSLLKAGASVDKPYDDQKRTFLTSSLYRADKERDEVKKGIFKALILTLLMTYREQFDGKPFDRKKFDKKLYDESPAAAHFLLSDAQHYAKHYKLSSGKPLDTYLKVAFSSRPGPNNYLLQDGGTYNVPIIEWAPISNNEKAIGVMMRLTEAAQP